MTVPQEIGGFLEVLPQGQNWGWEYKTGHFLHKPAWQGYPQLCFPQFNIFWQVFSHLWSSINGEVLNLQHYTLQKCNPQLFLFLQTLSHLNSSLVTLAFQHYIFLWVLPQLQLWSMITLQSAHFPSWQLKLHSCPQINFFLQGVPQTGIGS